MKLKVGSKFSCVFKVQIVKIKPRGVVHVRLVSRGKFKRLHK